MAPEQTIDDYDSMPWDTTLEPLEPMTLPDPTSELELGVFFDTMDNGINRAMFNSTSSSGLFSRLAAYELLRRCHMECACSAKHDYRTHNGRRCLGAKCVWAQYSCYGVWRDYADDCCQLGCRQAPFVSIIDFA